MIPHNFKGMGVALITPFTVNGDVDYDALDRLVDEQIAASTDFICIQGTTAETPTLTTDEKRIIRKRIIEKVAGRMPLMLGLGGNCTRSIVEDLKNEDLEGIDAILSVVPYYNKPTQEGMYSHFKAIADATELPIFLYNVPGRTGANMQVDTVVRLANDCTNIVGIKEASGNLEQIKAIIENTPDDFTLLSGDDGLTCDIMKLGGEGAISVIGNGYPEAYREVVHLMAEGTVSEAEALAEQLEPVIKLLFADGNPAGIKSLLAHRGMIENVLRLPLVPASEKVHGEMVQAMRTLDEYLKK